MELQQTTPNAISEEDITAPSSYDNSLSFLYKQARRLGIPYRFLLIEPKINIESRFVDTFDLEDNEDVNFITLFQYIRQLLLRYSNTSLIQLWDVISKFKGDTYNPLELISIYFHTMPEYQIEHQPILIFINEYLENLGEPRRFNNVTEAINYYATVWLPQYNQELSRDYNTLLNFVNAQREISNIQPVFHSDITLDSVIISYDYSTEPGINSLPDIFNSSVTDYVVPFIQYNIRPVKREDDQVERYYKIYKGRSVDSRPVYNNVILQSNQATKGQSIYMNVWADDDLYSEDIQDETSEVFDEARVGKKESFNTVVISYIEPQNTIRVFFSSPNTKSVNENTLIRRIHKHIPGLPPPQKQMINELRISGSFMIYNTDLVEATLFHLIMNDPLFSAYLYLEESGKSFAEKTRLNIHYRGALIDIGENQDPSRKDNKNKSKKRSAVSATISQESINLGDKYLVRQSDGTVNQFIADRTYPVINVKMSRAASRRVAYQFMDVLSRLFRRYCDSRNILNMYLYYVPEYAAVLESKYQQRAQGPGVPLSTAGGTVVETRITSVEELKKYAGDIFVSGYARKCQRPFQPKLIRMEEVSTWQKKYVIKGTNSEDRQIIAFPKENPRHIIVCPDDKYPYPGVMENKTLKNKQVYPYVPCCFRKNQISSSTSAFSKYYYGTVSQQARTTTSRNSHVYKTGKKLDPGRTGQIHSSIASFLKRYDDESGEFLKYGVPRSPNSFIHCVVLAVEFQSYMIAPDKEEWVSLLRSNLFSPDRIRPELLRQELYDMTNEDIVRVGTDNDEFFDPLRYYRALEELFDCNIYIFSNKDEDHETSRKISLLQLPRHLHFHAHAPVPGRNTVLISRHWGGEANALEYPQCEIIIDKRQNETRMLFDYSMNDLIYPALTFVGRTLSWQIFETLQVPSLTCRVNVYSSMNFRMIFGNIPIVRQFIDNSGKARVFELAPEQSQAGIFTSLRIYVNIPPTAPMNIPEFKPEEVSNNLPPYDKLIELLGEPISANISTDGRYLTGLWFPVGDIQFGFYCQCQDFLWTDFSIIYPNINHNSELASLTVYIPRQRELKRGEIRNSPIQRIKYLRRAADFVDQIVKYLYLIAGKPDDITVFLQSIASILGEPRGDSVDIYDINNIPRILPTGTDVQSVISQLATYAPIMFTNNRLLIYDEQMLNGITYRLKQYVKTIAGLPITAAQLRQIKGYYSRKSDFNFDQRFEFILGSLYEFNVWKQIYVPSSSTQQRNIQNLKSNIQTHLNVGAFSYHEPYIYQRSGNSILSTSYDPRADKFYLIQNVAGGDFKRAVKVAHGWYMNKINNGFTTEEWASDLYPAHIIYRISPGGGIIVQQNNSEGRDTFLEILNYGNEYAAMLPIL
jgi:hypothetical protein